MTLKDSLIFYAVLAVLLIGLYHLVFEDDKNTAPSCEAIYFATLMTCSEQLEHEGKLPLCEPIAQAGFKTCNKKNNGAAYGK